MDTLIELKEAVQNDLTIGDESSLLPPTSVIRAINRAYRKAAGLYRWVETEDADNFSAEANKQYYGYKKNWTPNSAWKLEVDGIDYGDPLVFKDFLFEIENNHPAGLMKSWGNYQNKFFIDPTPTVNGNENITVWGQKVVDLLVEDDDETIFSHSMPDCNEAIILEAVAILKAKGGEEPVTLRRYISGSFLLSIEAKQILENAWNKIATSGSKAESTTPFFEVPDFFRGVRGPIKRKIGDF